jgi:succinylarginine dihydrolase
MLPLSVAWGVRAVGFESFELPESAWHDGTAVLLIADAMKALLAEGVTLVEAVVPNEDSPETRVLRGLGYQEVDRAITMKKSL